MSYREEERARIRHQTSKQAIALAMQGRWQEVVEANKSLLKSFPNDVDAYNRLGRAYLELGEYPAAREAYEKALEFDPYNTIARKNLDRLSHLKDTAVGAKGGFDRVEPQQFIEEVGKAGVVKLSHLAPPEIIARTVAGGKANLRIDGASLVVENGRGEYLGQVEPRYGQRLIRLMEGGNEYTATVISAMEEAVTVIIREVYQDPSQAGQLSFLPKGFERFRPYVGDRIIRRELEYEKALSGEHAFTVIGGEEAELLPEETPDSEDEVDNEE